MIRAIVLSSPQALVSFYDVIYLPDSKPESKPSLALCLPIPFEAQKLRIYKLIHYFPLQKRRIKFGGTYCQMFIILLALPGK